MRGCLELEMKMGMKAKVKVTARESLATRVYSVVLQ